MEKDLNLKVSLLVRDMLKKQMPDLEVYLTRSTDTQLNASREADNLQRPRLANSKDADLFVSIHANALDNKDVAGAEVIVLSLDGATQGHTQKRTTAQDNEDYTHIDNIDKNSLAYIEAISTLMNNDPFNRTFGEILGNKFRAIGRKFRGVKIYPEKVWTVLYPLRSPGVIIEMGFMTNASELKYISSDEGQRQIAKAITDGIVEYLDYLEQMTVNETPATETTTTETPVQSAEQKAERATEQQKLNEGYTIQLMASASQLEITKSRFGTLSDNVEEFLGGGNYKYKYCYGRYTSREEARADIEKVHAIFADAYIVCFEGSSLK
jgi:N-acetylmuramoyl-L-alanine amidase